MTETSSPSNSDHDGLQLDHAADRSLTYFLAQAITNLLTAANPKAFDTIADVTAEIRRRNRTIGEVADKQLRYWLRLTSDHMRK